jgi:hypothetical protein
MMNGYGRLSREVDMQKLAMVIAAALLVAAAATSALASDPVATPEVSPGNLSAGLALLAGGVLLVKARMRR